MSLDIELRDMVAKEKCNIFLSLRIFGDEELRLNCFGNWLPGSNRREYKTSVLLSPTIALQKRNPSTRASGLRRSRNIGMHGKTFPLSLVTPEAIRPSKALDASTDASGCFAFMIGSSRRIGID